MSKRTTCQLAKTFDSKKHCVTRLSDPYMASEKLDGLRCLWIPASRGELVKNVPFANIQKTPQLAERISTGLWTRGWKPIFAPDAWVKKLPPYSLDGELFIGYGRFQDTCSVVRQYEAGASNRGSWDDVKFMVFDSPTVHQIFNDGIIDVGGKGDIFITLNGATDWLKERGWADLCCGTFDSTYHTMLYKITNTHTCSVLPQVILKSEEDRHSLYERVLDAGGEGIIYRKAKAFYLNERSNYILKEKPWMDAEGTVIGYTTGKKTDKGSKLLGKMGNLILEICLEMGVYKRLELSGFTEEERRLGGDSEEWAYENPGCVATSAGGLVHFKQGQIITFKYRELSTDGIPKEARYYRKG